MSEEFVQQNKQGIRAAASLKKARKASRLESMALLPSGSFLAGFGGGACCLYTLEGEVVSTYQDRRHPDKKQGKQKPKGLKWVLLMNVSITQFITVLSSELCPQKFSFYPAVVSSSGKYGWTQRKQRLSACTDTMGGVLARPGGVLARPAGGCVLFPEHVSQR